MTKRNTKRFAAQLLATKAVNELHRARFPFTVKRIEDGRAVLFGRYATKAEANAAAVKCAGFVTE